MPIPSVSAVYSAISKLTFGKNKRCREGRKIYVRKFPELMMHLHVALRAQVVDLVGLHPIDDRYEHRRVREISVVQEEACGIKHWKVILARECPITNENRIRVPFS